MSRSVTTTTNQSLIEQVRAERPQERWKIITRDSNYAVSDHGRIQRITEGMGGTWAGRILSPLITSNGRRQICLAKAGRFSLSLLVAEAFVPRPIGHERDIAPMHKDGNPANCRADNLEWMPKSSLSLSPRNINITPRELREICQAKGRVSATSLAGQYHISSSSIYRIWRDNPQLVAEGPGILPLPTAVPATNDSIRWSRCQGPGCMKLFPSGRLCSRCQAIRVARWSD